MRLNFCFVFFFLKNETELIHYKKRRRESTKTFYHVNLKSVFLIAVWLCTHSGLTGAHKMTDTLGFPFNWLPFNIHLFFPPRDLAAANNMCIYWDRCDTKDCDHNPPLQFVPLTQVPNFCPYFRRHVTTCSTSIISCFPTREACMLTAMRLQSRPELQGKEMGAKLLAVFFWYWCKRKARGRKAFVNWESFPSEPHSAGRWTCLRNPPKSLIRALNRLQEVRRDVRERSELTAYARFTPVRCRC